ncbi:MAG: Bug family tripartite tricarboxylate transporter substrate binding protein [Alphaproteobacteria bacterium]
MSRILHATLGVAGALLLAAPAATAQSVEDFYKGKSITILIAGTPGGGFDTSARTMAQHYGKFVPGNPNIVAQNMPGGGGLVAGNYLYNVAPKDGTVIAYVGPVAVDPLLNPGGNAKFEATKFNWIGSLGNTHSVLAMWHEAPTKTVEDLFAKETVVAGTGAAATTDIYPKVLNAVMGTKFKLITGYQGSRETFLAIERGEAHGRFASVDSMATAVPKLLADKKLIILLQASLKRHPEYPNVPTAFEIAKTPEQKQAMTFIFAPSEAGRPIAAPPGLPADRVKALRDAFVKMTADKEYIADAQKRGLDPQGPMSGAEVAELYATVYDTPKAVIDKVAAAMK